jgi:toxoflavin biosynthesis protein ToxD
LMGSTPEQAKLAIKDGANKEWVKWEQPQHSVELSEYSIGRYPVTNREYQDFVRDNQRPLPMDWSGDQFPRKRAANRS